MSGPTQQPAGTTPPPARERLIDATRELLWERGYACTSPGAIMKASRVGQGSMYHHFDGKEDLAVAAVERNATDMRAQVRTDLAGPAPALERLERFLRRERQVLQGCRFGKLAQDPDAAASAAISARVAEMFTWLEDELRGVLELGQREGDLPDDLDARRVAATAAATVQGGYVLARATNDPAAFDRAVDGLLDLLARLATRPS